MPIGTRTWYGGANTLEERRDEKVYVSEDMKISCSTYLKPTSWWRG